MGANARLFVDPPPFTGSPYGLFSVADMRTNGDAHWQNGVTFEDVCPVGGGTTFQTCTTSSPWASGTPASKADNADRSWYGTTPFTVFSEIDCSPPDFYDRADQLAERSLTRVESYQVERAFWTGTAANVANVVYPHLASTAVVTDGVVTLQMATTAVTGVALNVVDALGALEGALAACYNGVGVIHVPQTLAPVLAGLGLLVRDGPRYRTHNGNLVALGAGYPGTGPSGNVAVPFTSMWMYATGSVFVYRSTPRLYSLNNATLKRDVNTVKAIAERTYTIGYGCCLLAIPVSTVSVIATSTSTP